MTLPTHTARALATLDQLSDGRLTVHVITGRCDTEQWREGHYLAKDDRYARTHEYIKTLKKAWASREPFSHQGQCYKFEDFVSEVFPLQQPRLPPARQSTERRVAAAAGDRRPGCGAGKTGRTEMGQWRIGCLRT